MAAAIAGSLKFYLDRELGLEPGIAWLCRRRTNPARDMESLGQKSFVTFKIPSDDTVVHSIALSNIYNAG